MTTTTSAPYNCSEGQPEEWLPGQMRWCCDREQIGCNATTPPPPAGSESVSISPTGPQYTCGKNDDILTWNVSKRVFCCVNHQLGCPQTPPPVPPPPKPDPSSPKVGCFSVCSFQGYTSTCKGHIQWAAAEWYSDTANACLTSFGLLLQHCPVCNGCTLEQAQCQQPTKPPTTPIPPAVTPPATLTGEPPAATGGDAGTGADAPGGTPARADENATDPYDCDPAASDVESWTILQRVYCCREKEVACPKPPGSATAKDVHQPHQASSLHSTTSGHHHSVTTSSYEFNCESHFASWQKDWSADKQKWCCDNQGLGCSS